MHSAMCCFVIGATLKIDDTNYVLFGVFCDYGEVNSLLPFINNSSHHNLFLHLNKVWTFSFLFWIAKNNFYVSTGIRNISENCNDELMLVEVSKRTLQISERGQLEDAKKKTTESTASQVYVRTGLLRRPALRCGCWAVLQTQPWVAFVFWLGRPDARTGIWMPDVLPPQSCGRFCINHAELRMVALLNHTG